MSKNTENKEEISKEVEKNKGGRPPVWSSPEELALDIEHYLLFCEKNKEEIPDIESFCYFVMNSRNRDTFDRATFFRYEEKEGFATLIKKVKSFISYKKKQLGLQGKIPPAIFCFDFKNNHDYRDKTEQEHSGEVNQKHSGDLNVNLSFQEYNSKIDELINRAKDNQPSGMEDKPV